MMNRYRFHKDNEKCIGEPEENKDETYIRKSNGLNWISHSKKNTTSGSDSFFKSSSKISVTRPGKRFESLLIARIMSLLSKLICEIPNNPPSLTIDESSFAPISTSKSMSITLASPALTAWESSASATDTKNFCGWKFSSQRGIFSNSLARENKNLSNIWMISLGRNSRKKPAFFSWLKSGLHVKFWEDAATEEIESSTCIESKTLQMSTWLWLPSIMETNWWRYFTRRLYILVKNIDVPCSSLPKIPWQIPTANKQRSNSKGFKNSNLLKKLLCCK